ncbi:MAG: hypothetical protein A3J46_02570 [Candidatus Yanofskybacteria bacterium RIFCSPHIGHO2_02_FULL_41_11]|uniref:Uncharacterized protein n=1 Tax=Candidatus Yanofskybacteria bacterium RIFCSPHIGHO2_02_FULL_41_11 TaxID=1802675 RepID=A0A1F8F9H9_9BACT|nr:MAG: hypothetical protein A3J46_02570 [Candidatus Yanofskybacteria bacterium RIFCSPHIGHO2_02_FULL_41_11]
MDQENGIAIPSIATLDGFIEAVKKNDGLGVNSLPIGTTLLIETENSHYQLIILNPDTRSVIISSSDSKFIQQPTNGVLNGSTFGGRWLRSGWIGVGMRIEICLDNGTTLTTSKVEKISLVYFASSSRVTH